MSRRIITICAAALLAASCSSGSGSAAKSTTSSGNATSTSSAPTTAGPGVKKSTTVWLCKPGTKPDPCRNDTPTTAATTAIAADGTATVTNPKLATDPQVDCFYVYPTVSYQKTAVANLDIDPEEIAVANAQAARFSQVCDVYAPMYRQRTIGGIFGGKATPAESAYAFDDVKAAWEDYLANDNKGRGVILIGHSQGSFMLTELIATEIDTKPDVRKLLVSALLLGGNVTVPSGKDVGGSFKHVPVCAADDQTGCVVAYSAFANQPPEGSLFGHGGDGNQVVCTNPAALGGGKATLHNAFPVGASLLGGVGDVKDTVKTPWVSYTDLFTGECTTVGDYTWLQIDDVRSAGDGRPELKESPGPKWGLHLYDMNIAMGDLVSLAGSQAAAWKG